MAMNSKQKPSLIALAGLIVIFLAAAVLQLSKGRSAPKKRSPATAGQQLEAAPPQSGPATRLAEQAAPLPPAEVLATKPLQELLTLLASTGMQYKEQAVLLNNCATLLIEHRRYWKAVYFLDKALEFQPLLAEAQLNSAVALAELGHLGLAATHFEKAYQLKPGHPMLLENVALLRQEGIMGLTAISIEP